MSRAGHPSTSGAVGTERLTGIVIASQRPGVGFISAAGRSAEFFFHASDVVGGERLTPGQTVTFTPITTIRGPRAVRVAATERR